MYVLTLNYLFLTLHLQHFSKSLLFGMRYTKSKTSIVLYGCFLIKTVVLDEIRVVTCVNGKKLHAR